MLLIAEISLESWSTKSCPINSFALSFKLFLLLFFPSSALINKVILEALQLKHLLLMVNFLWLKIWGSANPREKGEPW